MKKANSNKPSSKSQPSSKSTPSNRDTISPFVRAFLKRVQNTVTRYKLWTPQESFIVAVSGGADSLCLLDVLVLLSKKYDFTLHVAHVNYRLRGADSDQDEVIVRERAAAYGLSLSVLHPKPTISPNLEEKLRDIRYRFFEKLRKEKGATIITLAHHEDDQAETFLLRLLRGSGMKGLSAMQPKNNFLVRPLIETSRADIIRYLSERHIPYRTDLSNADPKFLRNRLRHELIPLLEKNYQPRIKRVLAETATLLAHDYDFLEKTCVLPSTVSGTDLVFSVQNLRALDETFLRNQLRLLLAPLYDTKSPPKGIIEEFLKLLRSTKNKPQRLLIHGLKIERKGDTVRLLDFQS